MVINMNMNSVDKDNEIYLSFWGPFPKSLLAVLNFSPNEFITWGSKCSLEIVYSVKKM